MAQNEEHDGPPNASHGPGRRLSKARAEGPGPSIWAETGRYMGHGLQFALSTLFFLLVGWWLDSKIGTAPLLLILGAFVGGSAGFYSLYRHVTASHETTEEEER